VARSTIATILKQHGIRPSDERRTSWRTFLRAHWGALLAADFFATEVWTLSGLVTYYTVFVIELESRRVHILGSTPHPNEAFMLQVARHFTDPTDRVAAGPRFLICDRDQKWSTAVRQLLETSGLRVIQTPFRAPNCNAHAERFVRSIKEECLNRVIPLGEGHFRRTLAEFVAHYHRERNHQGLGNELIDSGGDPHRSGPVRRRHRIGGLLSFYHRAVLPPLATRSQSSRLSDTTRPRTDYRFPTCTRRNRRSRCWIARPGETRVATDAEKVA
jgi:transposase InsO family protein